MTKRMTKPYSLGYFNLARGLGILFVLAGHSMALFYRGSADAASISVFAGAGRVLGGGVMAMFFMISGFYFFRRSPWKCVKMQARLLLKPYGITAVVILAGSLLQNLMQGKPIGQKVAQLILTYLFGFNAVSGETFLGQPIGTVSIFWFVLALFVGWVLFNLICGLPGKTARIAWVCGFVLLSWVMSQLSHVWPWAIHTGFLAVGYIAVGHAIRKYDLLNQKLPIPAWIFLGTVSLICLAFGYVDIAPGIWRLGLLDVVGSFCMGFLLMRTYSRLMDWGSGVRCWGLVDLIGLNSIWFLCIHAVEKALIPWKELIQLLPDQPVLRFTVCFALRLAIVLVCFWLITYIRRFLNWGRRQKITLTHN